MPYVIKEIVFALGAMGIAAVFLYNSAVLTDSSAMMPRILCGLILLLACLMIFHAIRAERRGELAAQNARPPVNLKRIWIFMGLLVGYVLLAQPVGYFIITPVYILVACWYLRAAGVVTRVGLAVGVPLLVYLLFVRLLHLPVPMGKFSFFTEVMRHGMG